MKIDAAVLTAHGAPLQLQTLDLCDELQAFEVLVEMRAAGICHTDLSVQAGKLPLPAPHVLGHEGAGRIVRTGSAVTHLKAGDNVVLTFSSCGQCAACLQNQPAYCANNLAHNYSGCRVDGSHTLHCGEQKIGGNFFGQSSFASFAIANERNAIRVDDDVPASVLAPLGCGVQTGAGAVLRHLKPEVGSSLVVFGAGTVGLSAVMAAKIVGCYPIIVVEPNESRRHLALDLGATHAIDPERYKVGKEIATICGGADYALECTGNPQVLQKAYSTLKPQGTVVLLGAPALGQKFELDMFSLLFGRKIHGVLEGDSNPPVFIPQLVDLYRQGLLPVDRLVKTYPFEQINNAIDDMKAGKVIKPVLVW
jgi:aryl-alcohol dehydrogenase